MTNRDPLTAPQVRAMIDDAGVDRNDLEIETDPEIWHDHRTGEDIQGVLIGHGPSRAAVIRVLQYNGLLIHPHDEHYSWVINPPNR
ncbi:hypothetical protein ACFV9C_42650 [Kribbella sp. NPDC059898]|uniref:hypothetical protein n=1 Tax=Kribbella sp. NPDC059898 TaxID=3346995 RepID=UPI00365B4540